MNDINIGMTFYGGVSLAVYEAGVAEEIIRFVQFCKERRGLHPMPEVNVQVISGTSAGGLAAVLMSATLVNSADPAGHIEEMRRIWFDVADISRLQYSAGQNVRSLLNNDILEEEVDGFLRRGGGASLCANTKIVVTGTNMQGYFDAVPVEEDFVNKGVYANRAFPTVRHTEVFQFNADEIAAATGSGDMRKKIAKSARITSSFPGAFPPQYTQSPSFPEETFRLFVDEHGRPLERPLHFWYFDGGVLDNKPLGHAIDHMQSSADGHWWFFFVEPKPEDTRPKHQEWGSNPEEPPDPACTAWTVAEVRGAETIYHDLKRIQKINHQVQQVNGLVLDMWKLAFEGCSREVDYDAYIAQLEDNVRTARLHRFLPDYLKCVTMLFYRFVRQARADSAREGELKERHAKIIDRIRPLDMGRIISECRRQVEERKLNLYIEEEDVAGLLDRMKAPGLAQMLVEYEKAAEVVQRAQLRFRQVAFWVEDDFRTLRKRGEEDRKGVTDGTWKVFTDALSSLEDTLAALDVEYLAVMAAVAAALDSDALVRKVRLFVMISETVHATAGLETREEIRVARIYHDERQFGPLLGAQLANFGGFIERRWRRHDYLMGMWDAREMLKARLKGKDYDAIFTPAFWNDYNTWREEREAEIRGASRLGPGDAHSNGEDKTILDLPAAKLIPQIRGILKTTGKLLHKYEERPFYRALKKVQADILLLIMRLALWVIDQATAQPPNGGAAKTRLAGFIAGGRRYMGFMLIGVIIGLALSFFLPDALKDLAHWLYRKISGG